MGFRLVPKLVTFNDGVMAVILHFFTYGDIHRGYRDQCMRQLRDTHPLLDYDASLCALSLIKMGPSALYGFSVRP